MARVVKNPPANAGDIRDKGSIPGSGRSAGEEHGNPFQYSFPENPMDRGAWWATVLRVAKSRTRLKCPTSATTLYHNPAPHGTKTKKNQQRRPRNKTKEVGGHTETVSNPGSNRRDGFKNVRVHMLQKECVREGQKRKHWI